MSVIGKFDMSLENFITEYLHVICDQWQHYVFNCDENQKGARWLQLLKYFNNISHYLHSISLFCEFVSHLYSDERNLLISFCCNLESKGQL